MSECVVRMEMPKKCYQCDIRLRCSPFLTKAGQTKPMCEGCRIICSLPEGHGRLVDSEEDVSNYITVWDCNCSEFGRQTVMAVEDLQYLPTIVPAEAERSET